MLQGKPYDINPWGVEKNVEGANAELRHYLARLASSSRCFSPCIEALRRAIKLFGYAWNRRQLHRHRFSKYPAHVFQFL